PKNPATQGSFAGCAGNVTWASPTFSNTCNADSASHFAKRNCATLTDSKVVVVIPRTSSVRLPNPAFCTNYARTVTTHGAEDFEDGCLVTFRMVGVCLG